MRSKSILLSIAMLGAVGANAQVILKENKSLIGKITANWCPPCGQWGMPLMDDMVNTHASQAVGLSIYSSTRTDNSNQKFQNQAAYDLAALITLTGYPSFSLNLEDKSGPNSSQQGVNTAGIKSDVAADVTAFSASPVIANTGMYYRIKGNIVTVDAKVKFFEAVNGQYKVAIYLVEDGITAGQATVKNGQGVMDNLVHHNILRTSMSATTWGEELANGAIAKDKEFTKSFSFDLSAPFTPSYADVPTTWDKTKLVPYAVIYKVNGSKHEYVNSTRFYQYPASVGELSAVQNLAIWPNPATTEASMSFEMQEAGDVTITVVDNLGRTVYNSGALNANTGRFHHTINTSNMAAGIYNVSVATSKGISTEKLSVQ